MTLHHLFANIGGHVYWWYAAIPNERRGKWHILKVPHWTAVAERIQIPRWGFLNEADYRERNAKTYIPTSVQEGQAVRACNTRQNSRFWYVEKNPATRADRGICADCVEWQREHVELMGFPVPNYPTDDIRYRRIQANSSLTAGEADWVRKNERRFYGEAG